MQLTPYIIFDGSCEEALNFYARAMNGEVKSMMYFKDAPGEMEARDEKAVMHAHFEGNGIFFMASDSGENAPEVKKPGNVHLSLNFDSAEEEEKVFNALSEGAKVTMPLQDTFWGARFGMLTDRFGINWMFNFELNKQ